MSDWTSSWLCFGSKSGRADYTLLLSDSRVLSPAEERKFEIAVDQRFQDQFAEYWRFFAISDDKFVLTRTSWLRGGTRGEDFVVWALVLPFEYVVHQQFALGECPAMFPQPTKDLSQVGTNTVSLPIAERRPIWDEAIDMRTNLLTQWLDSPRSSSLNLSASDDSGSQNLAAVIDVFTGIADRLTAQDRVRFFSFSTMSGDRLPADLGGKFCVLATDPQASEPPLASFSIAYRCWRALTAMFPVLAGDKKISVIEPDYSRGIHGLLVRWGKPESVLTNIEQLSERLGRVSESERSRCVSTLRDAVFNASFELGRLDPLKKALATLPDSAGASLWSVDESQGQTHGNNWWQRSLDNGWVAVLPKLGFDALIEQLARDEPARILPSIPHLDEEQLSTVIDVLTPIDRKLAPIQERIEVLTDVAKQPLLRQGHQAEAVKLVVWFADRRSAKPALPLLADPSTWLALALYAEKHDRWHKIGRLIEYCVNQDPTSAKALRKVGPKVLACAAQANRRELDRWSAAINAAPNKSDALGGPGGGSATLRVLQQWRIETYLTK